MKNILSRIELYCIVISGVAIASMVALGVTEVTLRYIFNTSITGSFMFLTHYSMVGAFFLALAYTQREKKHISLDAITRYLPKTVQRWLIAGGYFLSALFLALIAYAGCGITVQAYSSGVFIDQTLQWPQWTSFVFVVIGSVVAVVRFVADGWTTLTNPDHEEPEQEVIN